MLGACLMKCIYKDTLGHVALCVCVFLCLRVKERGMVVIISLLGPLLKALGSKAGSLIITQGKCNHLPVISECTKREKKGGREEGRILRSCGKRNFFIKVGERYGSRWVIQALPPFF